MGLVGLNCEAGAPDELDVGRIAFVSLVVVAGVLASACEEPNTTDYDPMGVAAAEAGMIVVSPEEITSCVESTMAAAMAGEADAQALWDSVAQSRDALQQECNRIGIADPDRLAQMHWNWTASQSAP